MQEVEHDSATAEPRAFFSLCAVKEFLIVCGLFLICVDLFDVYTNIIRLTGTDYLPFWGNHTEFFETRIVELNEYDMGISTLDLVAVIVLTLSGAPHGLPPPQRPLAR